MRCWISRGWVCKIIHGRLLSFFSMDPKKFIIWNVRGLNSRCRRDAVRTLVDAARVDVVCLQETETEMTTITQRKAVISMLGAEFNEFSYLPSIGASGGILMAWKRGVKSLVSAGKTTLASRCNSSQVLVSLGGSLASMAHKVMNEK